MVLTAYFVLSPVTGLFCHRRLADAYPRNLTPASGRQDHTALPSALAPLVLRHCRVHRIPPRVDDVAQRPSVGQDGGSRRSDLPDAESEIFLRKGLDSEFAEQPVGQISGAETEHIKSVRRLR